MELKNEKSRFRPLFLCQNPSVQAIFRGLSLLIEMGHKKVKKQKDGSCFMSKALINQALFELPLYL